MKKLMNRFIFISLLCSISFSSQVFANNCDQINEKGEKGEFTARCLQEVLETFAFEKSDGFFIFTISEAKNIYAQGVREKDKKSFRIEISGPKYTKFLTKEGMKKLLLAGWNLSGGDFPNFYKFFSAREFVDGTASRQVFESFQFYELDTSKSSVTYTISDF